MSGFAARLRLTFSKDGTKHQALCSTAEGPRRTAIVRGRNHQKYLNPRGYMLIRYLVNAARGLRFCALILSLGVGAALAAHCAQRAVAPVLPVRI